MYGNEAAVTLRMYSILFDSTCPIFPIYLVTSVIFSRDGKLRVVVERLLSPQWNQMKRESFGQALLVQIHRSTIIEENRISVSYIHIVQDNVNMITLRCHVRNA